MVPFHVNGSITTSLMVPLPQLPRAGAEPHLLLGPRAPGHPSGHVPWTPGRLRMIGNRTGWRNRQRVRKPYNLPVYGLMRQGDDAGKLGQGATILSYHEFGWYVRSLMSPRHLVGLNGECAHPTSTPSNPSGTPPNPTVDPTRATPTPTEATPTP